MTWDWIIGQLMTELPEIVEDFLEEFKAKQAYPNDQVGQQDVADTARQTFDLLLRRLRGEPDPPGAAGLIERLAARRAQQGVPLATFLRAVRIDFRVLWLRAQRIAGDEGSSVLAENAMRLLTTVEDYIDALRSSYQAEEDRIDRTYAAQRHRMVLRLFSGAALTASEIELIGSRLNMQTGSFYEVDAVTGEGIGDMLARYESKPEVGLYENVSALVMFREQLGAERWRRDAPGIGGYVGEVEGLAAVPQAAEAALEIARHAPASPHVLATEDEVWATVARRHLAGIFPRFTGAITERLNELPEHDRDRLIEAAITYISSGSVKETAEQLFCHRNTVINRLKMFAETTGYDPTVPKDAAWIFVALSPDPEN